ncbi:abortive infection family protein [Macrococcus epidermidis]|uniref:abortive infection family protein n=1 Tax=Macrococcus epidermidis TaxID=1902580 RepID=UPI0020B8E9F9|nr:abortive infection family protein [Macrococcus epidermidis]UTH16252.1 abortive infection family protein [Macrococcus epidermidis]
MKKIIINDEVIAALSLAVDDKGSNSTRRDPSHSQIESLINRFGLEDFDPSNGDKPVGKRKRIYGLLSSTLESPSEELGEQFAFSLIDMIRGLGGFRKESLNYIGEEAVANLKESLKNTGYTLSLNGVILEPLLDNMNELEKEEVLMGYVNRAKKGHQDAALVVGTSKDLLEATALHILTKVYHYDKDTYINFPTLLGQAFLAVDLCSNNNEINGDDQSINARKEVEYSLYKLGCSINKYRNKVGIGHGRPFVPEISEEYSKVAIESMGMIAELLLSKLKNTENKY